MNVIEEARTTLASGKAEQAVALLEAGGAAGDPRCWMELGFMFLQARGVPRDLRRSRDYFRKAAELGEPQGQAITISLLANGTGGRSDFAEAMRLLEAAAPGSPDLERQLELVRAMDLTDSGDPRAVPPPRQLSQRPFVQLFPKLLTTEECRYLIAAAGPAFRPAPVGSVATGALGYSQVRTCDVAYFPWVAENAAIHAINRRLAAASGSAVECGEPLQILRYRPGQEFKPHRDCTEATDNQRVLTMLVYLNEGYSGGETHFLETGLKVSGSSGDALLFRNADEQGRPDAASLHAGLPVLAGEKLVASRWIRQKRFGPA